ncbi:MAG: hypothetical protein U0P30_12345 [Vicinamibacterales bacterium]
MERRSLLAASVGVVALAVACAQNPESPVSPSAAAGNAAANVDGSTLKVSAPTPSSPANGSKVDTRKPTFVFDNATGKFTSVALEYRVQLFDAAGNVVNETVVGQGTGGNTSLSSASDLNADVDYAWRVRAEYQTQVGPWSNVWTFHTPAPAGGVVGTVDDGTIGPPRNISINELFNIVVNIHNTLRVDLGSASTRDGRIAFWSAAIAAVHYGHSRFNPQGPDSGWCIKDAGGGRPISDDVPVRCVSRDFWDMIGGAGANGYSFHIEYSGILPSSQNVYPPPRSALSYLNR